MTPSDLAVVFASGKFGSGYPIEEFRYDDASNPSLPTHIGIAPQGSATSASAWIVKKLTYDASGRVTSTRISPKNSVMDSYASLTYT